jgi:amidase
MLPSVSVPTASACGIVGIKPTLGLVSRGGIVPVSLAQDTAGPMARSVADAAALLSALAGADPADPATAERPGPPLDYSQFLDASALAGARIGVWRDGTSGAGAATAAVLEQALDRLRQAGAELMDPVKLPEAEQVTEPEFAALTHEFKHDLNAYLAGLRGPHPATLAELIEFNIQYGETVLAHFGQEHFERAEATSGDLADPAHVTAREEARYRAQGALLGPITAHHLDAIVTLTANPAWLTDYVLGDHDMFHTSGPSAVAGYPAVTVPAGNVSGLPVGLSFLGRAYDEPTLIALAYAFEQVSPPRLVPALCRDRTASGPQDGR